MSREDGKVNICDYETMLPEIWLEYVRKRMSSLLKSVVGELKYEILAFTPWLK